MKMQGMLSGVATATMVACAGTPTPKPTQASTTVVSEQTPEQHAHADALWTLEKLAKGAVLLGDLFDFGFKANRRNLRLIQHGTSQPIRERHLADYLVIVVFALIILSLITLPFLLAALLVANLSQR